MKITVVLHNIRSTYNVGAILRTAEGLGIKQVVYSGYTPRYNDLELLPHLREKLNRQIAKSALDAEKLVPQLLLNENLSEWLRQQSTATIIGLENNLSPEEQARRIVLGQAQTATGEKVDFDKDVILVLGEEVDGIPTEIRSQLDYFLEIPMYGQKESFNVSVATGIALWGLQNCYRN